MSESTWNRRAVGRAALGVSATLCAGARLSAAAPAAAPPSAAGTRWSVEAARNLRIRQELAWSELGKRMGLGEDPMVVYRALERGRMPSTWIAPAKFWAAAGGRAGARNLPGDPAGTIAAYEARYGAITPPTPYEDPNLYAILLEMSDDIEAALQARHLPVPARLVLGTLPSNTLDACTITLPVTHEHIVLFERGLFDFAFRMSRIAALAFPSIDPATGWFAQPVDTARDVGRHPEILDQLQATLQAYLVEGDPRRAAVPPIGDSHVMTAAILLRSLELFALGHEYGHIVAGHSDNLGPNPSTDATVRYNWDTEYGADSVGVSLMTSVMGDFRLGFWGAGHWFACREIVDRCLAILATGAVEAPSLTSTHPPNLERSRQLRAVVRDLRPGPETEQAIALASQLDSFWGRLWQISEPTWVGMHKQGKRPAAIWQ